MLAKAKRKQAEMVEHKHDSNEEVREGGGREGGKEGGREGGREGGEGLNKAYGKNSCWMELSLF